MTFIMHDHDIGRRERGHRTLCIDDALTTDTATITGLPAG